LCLHKLYTSEEPLIREANQGASEYLILYLHNYTLSEPLPAKPIGSVAAIVYRFYSPVILNLFQDPDAPRQQVARIKSQKFSR